MIFEQGVDDALERVSAFAVVGADGIMIHSRMKDLAEIARGCGKFRA